MFGKVLREHPISHGIYPWADTIADTQEGKGELSTQIMESVKFIDLYNINLTKEIGRNNARFLSFHRNTIIPPIIKNGVPQRLVRSPSFINDEFIFEIGKTLGKFIRVKHYDLLLAKYCYLLGLFYAFEREPNFNLGAFLYFQYNKRLFLWIKNKLQAELSRVKTGEDLDMFVTWARSFLLLASLRRWRQNSIDLDSISWGQARKEFVNNVKKDPENEGIVEPLTWHLLQVLGEATSRGVEIDRAKRFVLASLGLYSRIYKENKHSYEKMFFLEDGLISDLSLPQN